MKNRVGGLVTGLIVLLFLSGIWLCDQPGASSLEEGGGTAIESDPLVTDTQRTLGVWEGRLALYTAESVLPEQVYDVWVAALPESEQQRLAAGIAVADEASLMAYLEDYTS